MRQSLSSRLARLERGTDAVGGVVTHPPTADEAAVDALVAAFLEKHPNHRGPVIVLPEQFETPEEWEAWYQAQDEMDSV